MGIFRPMPRAIALCALLALAGFDAFSSRSGVAMAQDVALDINEACPDAVSSLNLESGDNCIIDAELQPDFQYDVFFQTGVISRANYSLLVQLVNVEGDADMEVVLSNGFAVRQARVVATPLEEDYYFSEELLLSQGPQTWRVRVTTDDLEPVAFQLRITAVPEPRELREEDAEAMMDLREECCQAEGSCTLLDQLNSTALDFCHVPGIVCTEDGRIRTLVLPDQGMSCPFPRRELSRLTSLRVLDLSSNNITGDLREVSASLINLLELQALQLQDTALSGELPCALAASPQLTLFLLSNTNASGSLPSCILNSSRIRVIRLDGTRISGELPPVHRGVGAPTELRILDISNLQGDGLTGELPSFLPATSLHTLNLQGNNLTGPLPEVPAGLRILNLAINSLEGTIPSAYGQLTDLEVLDLWGNNLTGSIPDGLRQQQKLGVLDLGSNQLTGELGTEWNTSSLRVLSLADNRLTGPIPASVVSPMLGLMDLSFNQLTGDLEELAVGLVNQTQQWMRTGGNNRPPFYFLDLDNNSLVGGLPEVLEDTLLFQPSRFTLQDASGAQVRLNELASMANNQLTGPWPAWLVRSIIRFPALLSVDMSGNLLECPESIDAEFFIAPTNPDTTSLLVHSCVNTTTSLVQSLADVPIAPVVTPAPETDAPATTEGEGSEDSGSAAQTPAAPQQPGVASERTVPDASAGTGTGTGGVSLQGEADASAGSSPMAASSGSSDGGDDGVSAGVVVAVVLAAVAVAVLLVATVVLLRRRGGRKLPAGKFTEFDAESEMVAGNAPPSDAV